MKFPLIPSCSLPKESPTVYSKYFHYTAASTPRLTGSAPELTKSIDGGNPVSHSMSLNLDSVCGAQVDGKTKELLHRNNLSSPNVQSTATILSASSTSRSSNNDDSHKTYPRLVYIRGSIRIGVNAALCAVLRVADPVYHISKGVAALLACAPVAAFKLAISKEKGFLAKAAEVSRALPVLGPNLLQLAVIIRCPSALSLNPIVKSLRKESRCCEIQAELPDRCYMRNDVLCIDLATIATFGYFASNVCVQTLTDSMDGVCSYPTDLHIETIREARGNLHVRLAFSVEFILTQFTHHPGSVLQQAIECDIRNSRGKIVAKVRIRFAFAACRKDLKRQYS